MNNKIIPFNQTFISGNEFKYMNDACNRHHISGDGYYSKLCATKLRHEIKSKMVLLTPSGTAALELSALACKIKPGDEVIMPSYTFTSTANAFVLRGAVPIFVDIKENTLNIDEDLIEEAISEKTKAIVVVHYAGISCDMDKIVSLVKKYNLILIEDSAQAINAYYKDKPLGSFGDFAAFSFHETKNISCGEGGAIAINDEKLAHYVEILREKGTDRSKFFRNEVNKYSWRDMGSSFLLSDLSAAFLYSQLEHSEAIKKLRLKSWNYYHMKLENFEIEGLLKRPYIPNYNNHNAHIYYIVLNKNVNNKVLSKKLNGLGISAIPHYEPLHNSEAGIKYGKFKKQLLVTEKISEKLLRLPLWAGIKEEDIDFVIKSIREVI